MIEEALEASVAYGLRRLELFAFDLRFVGRLVLLVRIVVPTFVRRPLAAAHALRVEPLMPATGTETARPKRVPHGPAVRIARPAIRRARAPLTERAIDLGFALHDGVVASLSTGVENCDHSM